MAKLAFLVLALCVAVYANSSSSASNSSPSSNTSPATSSSPPTSSSSSAQSTVTYGSSSSPDFSIVENIGAIPGLSNLYSLLISPGYEVIENKLNTATTQYTFFAPSNQALAGVDTTKIGEFTALLEYHVLPQVISTTGLKQVQFLDTLTNNASWVNLGNGMPQVLGVYGDYDSILLSYGNRAAGQYVIIARGPIACSNGVMFVLDSLLELPGSLSDAASFGGASLFNDALEKEDLSNEFDMATGGTFFVPLNEYLQNINFNSFNMSFATDVLNQHFVPGQVIYSTDFDSVSSLKNAAGDYLFLSSSEDGFFTVNGFNIETPDVLLENGVMHIIGGVLMPPQ